MSNNVAPKEAKLSFKEKLCYGLGDVSNGLAAASIGFWLLKYLTDVAGLSAFLAGVAIMIGRAWDAITDPIMGWVTDHTKSRWGKRRPYLLFGAIPYALAFFSLWVIPDYANEHSIFIYTTLALVAFNTCLTVVFVPYTSLTAAITEDYHERTSLTAFRMTASQSSILLGAALPSALVLWVISPGGIEFLDFLGIQEAFGSWAGTKKQGYFMMAGLFACIMIVSIWTAFFGVRERDIEVKPQEEESTPLDYASTILDELQGNRPFRISVLILLLTNCAATLVAVNLSYFLEYALEMRDHQTRVISLLFVTAIMFVPFWNFMAKKFGKAETYRGAMLLYVFVLCGMPFLQPRQVELTYLIAFLGGIFHSAALMIPWAIVPDIVEYDELKTGQRREGLFYGGTTFSYKLATALAVFFSGTVLETIGYVPNVAQPLEVVLGIKTIIGPAAALMLVMGAYLSTRYPLTAERHSKIREELRIKKGMV